MDDSCLSLSGFTRTNLVSLISSYCQFGQGIIPVESAVSAAIRLSMWVFMVFIWLLLVLWSAQPAVRAETVPAPPAQPPSESPALEPAPAPRDPGMVKQPDVEPLPGSVVVPPVVDPKIAINPEEPKPQESPSPSDREPDQRQPERPSR